MKKKMEAITISPTELRANQKKYFDMAEKTRVFVKRGTKLIELVVSDSIQLTPSPSSDSWFDRPRNMKELMERVKRHESGDTKFITLDEARKKWGNTK